MDELAAAILLKALVLFGRQAKGAGCRVWMMRAIFRTLVEMFSK